MSDEIEITDRQWKLLEQLARPEKGVSVFVNIQDAKKLSDIGLVEVVGKRDHRLTTKGHTALNDKRQGQ
jgi:hypothetical protein